MALHGEMADEQSCPVCSKIIGIFRGVKENPGSSASAELGEVSLIIDMPCPHAGSIRRVWETLVGDDSLQHWSVGLRYDHMYESVEFVLSYDGQEETWVPIGLVNRPKEPSHPGKSRGLDPEWADVSVLRAWHDACSKHGELCQEPALKRAVPGGVLATPTWLMDVVDECILPFSPATSRYLTLSYSWGRVDCLRHLNSNIAQLRKAGALQPDKAPLIPRTVRDAMGITKLLGERYLWVDSLCINQDSAATSKDLHVMHHIYANAVICLMAMAGTDAAHGLRGIKGVSSAPRDSNQVILDIAGEEQLAWTQWPPDSYPVREDDARQGSAYSERGWTFQEYIFAQRRLIFTDGPLRWICNSSEFAEESLERLTHTDFHGMDVPRTAWLGQEDPSLGAIDIVARRFNGRYFTFEADALNGFLGIQNHLNGIQRAMGRLNYGHPEMFFDISLAWTPSPGTVRRLDPPEIKSNRPSPPTWSWMGWRGPFSFPNDGEFHGPADFVQNGFTEPVAPWFAMHSPQTPAPDRRPINCAWHKYRTLAKDKAFKVPEGWKKGVEADGSKYYYRAEPCAGDPNQNPRPPRHGYPVPLPPKTLEIEPIEQLPFLFAKTTRCRFDVKEYQASQSVRGEVRDCPVELSCRDGHTAGFLLVHDPSDLSGILASEVLELVAVAKGWTTVLGDFFEAFRGKEGSARAGAKEVSWGGRSVPVEHHTRQDCYFVLFVECEDGVAKRRASGVVAADIWEQHKEPVDLVLG